MVNWFVRALSRKVSRNRRPLIVMSMIKVASNGDVGVKMTAALSGAGQVVDHSSRSAGPLNSMKYREIGIIRVEITIRAGRVRWMSGTFISKVMYLKSVQRLGRPALLDRP